MKLLHFLLLKSVKIYTVTFFSIFFCNSFIHGSDMNYKASLIAPALTKNAKAVVRIDETVIEVSKNDAVEEHTKAITILNKNGYDLSILHEIYSEFVGLSGVKVRIFDSNGEKVKSYYGSDIKDYSAIDGYTLYNDYRQKYFDPEYRMYPFTIEISFKRKLKSLFFLPEWMPCENHNCSIEKSKLTVKVNNDASIRYFEKNLIKPCETSTLDKQKIYAWEINNMPALSEEDFEESFVDFLPIVYLAPNEFEVDDIKGDFSTWENFGKWILKLNDQRDTLSQSTISKIKELTNGLSIKEKIQKVYEYMQKHTHYVSVQVGIGGWQPFNAMTVDRLAYGDCKALSNYTFSLLKAAGVPSNYTLILAGENEPKTIQNFPSNMFNHAIVAVPLDNDTLFLECTSQYFPYGHIGSFTDDRPALMITKDGGKIIHTRKYKSEENLTCNRSTVTLTDEGSGNCSLNHFYSGVNFDEIKYLSIRSNEDIKKALYKSLNIANYQITDFSFSQPDPNLPIINSKLHLNLDRYAMPMNKKLIIPLNLSNRVNEIPIISDDRKSKILIRRSKIEIDSVEYILPEGFAIERTPQAINISSEFAHYESKCNINQQKHLIYVRKLSINEGSFNPSEAMKFKEFYTKVSQADMLKVTASKTN